MMIASSWESPEPDHDGDLVDVVDLRDEERRIKPIDADDVQNGRADEVSHEPHMDNPADGFPIAEPRTADQLPARLPPRRERAGAKPVAVGGALSRRLSAREVIDLPARPRASQIATVRRDLRPAAASGMVELCVVSRLTGESEIVRIDAPVALIGRGSQCDIRLMHADVSRRHACLQVLEQGVLCFDLGSRTGVRWEGERRALGWIGSDWGATVGPFEIRLAREDDAIGAIAVQPGATGGEIALIEPPDAADPELETMGFELIEADASTELFLPLKKTVARLGRDPGCEMCVRDTRISRVHSSVIAGSDGVWLMDLAGRGGTRVNGRRVSHARLEPGDEVAIGDHRLRFVVDQPRRPFERNADHRPAEPFADGAGDGYVSESLVLAMVETFAEMQRQMQEEFRVQMDSMVEMVDSLRRESREDVRTELARLKSLGEEIRETQSRLTNADVPDAESTAELESGADPSDATVADASRAAGRSNRAGRVDAVGRTDDLSPSPVESGPVSTAGHAKSRRGESGPRRDRRERGGAHEKDGIGDHVLVSRRLRALQEERDSSWQKLVRMLMPNR